MSGRLAISDVAPVVNSGSHPTKAVVGEHIPITATVWREGHEAVAAEVVWRCEDGRSPARTVPMTLADPGLDHWQAVVVPDRQGMWSYHVEAWGDPWATWLHGIRAKIAAGHRAHQVAADLETGARLLERLAAQSGEPQAPLLAAARLRRTDLDLTRRLEPALGEAMAELAGRTPLRDLLTPGAEHRIWADRERALHGAWYELFPRSTGGTDATGAAVHGTFTTAAAELPRVAAMGFDVVYLPPVHPIGHTHRKGPNNALHAGPGDVGSPWAVGSAEGGHDAVHPELGTLEDFDAFVSPPEACTWRSPWTSRSSAPPITRGYANTPSGSPPGPTGRSPTPRTRPRPTRTSIPSTSTTTPRACRPNCCASCCSGPTAECASSASTTRTPSRCPSGTL